MKEWTHLHNRQKIKTMTLDLVPIVPHSKPTGILYYMDFWYDTIGDKKELRKKKLNILIRPDKLEYIDKLIKNN